MEKKKINNKLKISIIILFVLIISLCVISRVCFKTFNIINTIPAVCKVTFTDSNADYLKEAHYTGDYKNDDYLGYIYYDNNLTEEQAMEKMGYKFEEVNSDNQKLYNNGHLTAYVENSEESFGNKILKYHVVGMD